MGEAQSDITALRQSIDRLITRIDRLISILEHPPLSADMQSRAQMQEMMDRPEVQPEDRNTPPDFPEEGDDAARV
jgi:hypothetical protein